jgi:hypothetical protein
MYRHSKRNEESFRVPATQNREGFLAKFIPAISGTHYDARKGLNAQ